MQKIKITQCKSAIGQREDQKRNLIALGLTKLNQTVEHQLTPSIRGMIKKSRHLIKVENL